MSSSLRNEVKEDLHDKKELEGLEAAVHAFAAVEANENIRNKLEADEQTTLVAMANEARRRLETEQR